MAGFEEDLDQACANTTFEKSEPSIVVMVLPLTDGFDANDDPVTMNPELTYLFLHNSVRV